MARWPRMAQLRIVGGGGGPGPDPDPDPEPTIYTPDYFIGPTAAGSGNGSSWANRAALSSLNAAIAAVGPGGVIGIALHLGPYTQTSALPLTNSGGQGTPVLIVGINAAGEAVDPSAAPITGSRTDWTSPSSFQPVSVSGWTIGNDLFALGATSWLKFKNLYFKRFRDTITITSGHDHVIEDCTWYNTRSNFYAGSGASAYNIDLIRPTAIGFSKEAVRMWGTCQAFYIEDPQWDARWQDKEAHCRGLFLDQNSFNVTIQSGVTRDGWIRNCYYSTKDANGFRQGEAICGEEYNHHINVKGTAASPLEISGCTDAAFDVKSDYLVAEYVNCVKNKRSFRLWGRQGVSVKNCKSIDPMIYPLFNGDENGYILHTWAGCYWGVASHINYDNLTIKGGPNGVQLFNGFSSGVVAGASVTAINTQYVDLPASYSWKSGTGWTFNITPAP